MARVVIPVKSASKFERVLDWLKTMQGIVVAVGFFAAASWSAMIFALGMYFIPRSEAQGYVKTEDLNDYVTSAELDEAVNDIKTAIKDSARMVQCDALLEDIEHLEQTVLYRQQKGDSHALESTMLDSARRRLTRMKECVEE